MSQRITSERIAEIKATAVSDPSWLWTKDVLGLIADLEEARAALRHVKITLEAAVVKILPESTMDYARTALEITQQALAATEEKA